MGACYLRNMQIGKVELKAPTIFAPLAGISNLPLRLLVKASGCGLVCSEMVSAYGLAYGSAKTFDLLASGETTGVFQLEGAGMRRYIKDLKPSAFSDIAAMVG